MKKHWIFALTLILILITGSALAMSLDNYTLEWHLLSSGGGGGEASSPNYVINMSVGQTAIGESSSPNFGTGLGYWYGLLVGLLEQIVYLPIINH